MRARPNNTNGYRFSYRTATDGDTTLPGDTPDVSYPNTWVRLQRVGDTFTGYYGSDGTNWTSLGNVTVDLPDTIYVGLAASAHNASSPASTTTVQFRDITSA